VPPPFLDGLILWIFEESRLNLVSLIFSGEEVFGNRDSGLTVKLKASGRGTRARGIGGSSIASLVVLDDDDHNSNNKQERITTVMNKGIISGQAANLNPVETLRDIVLHFGCSSSP
jgi:hypothetical protein